MAHTSASWTKPTAHAQARLDTPPRDYILVCFDFLRRWGRPKHQTPPRLLAWVDFTQARNDGRPNCSGASAPVQLGLARLGAQIEGCGS